MEVMRFPTKVLYLLGAPSSQASTMELLLHAWTWLTGISRAVLIEVRSLASKAAPQSSSLGIEMVLTGATFVLAITKRLVGG